MSSRHRFSHKPGCTVSDLLICPLITAMVRKNCSAGRKWDNLVTACVTMKMKVVKTETLKVPLQQTVVDRPPASPANPVTLLTPPLWLFVLLSTVGSILVLTVWIIIFKRSKRNNVTPDDAEPGPEPVQKAEVQTEAHLLLSDGLSQTQAPTPCVHLHLGASTESKREGGPVLDKQWLPKYSTTREHRIPLPATELGGTALVTTKTV